MGVAWTAGSASESYSSATGVALDEAIAGAVASIVRIIERERAVHQAPRDETLKVV
jgi:hypothetical protein